MVPPQVHDGVETVFGIQDKARNLIQPDPDATGAATFEITVAPHCNAAGDLDWSGLFVHGKPGERFLYLGWRPANGPTDNWIRRWKISLASLPTECDAAEITIEATESKNVWIGSIWKTTSNL